jgi:hypothetical protein
LLSFSGQTTEGKRGVYSVHPELESSIGWVEVDPGSDAQLQVVSQGQSTCRSQGSVYANAGPLEERHAESGGHGLPGYLGWLD